MSAAVLWQFVVASMAIIIVPGPSVTFTIARAIAWGRATAVLSVLGNTLGTFVLCVVVAVGLSPLLTHHLITRMLEIAGGAYLIVLGSQAWRHRHAAAAAMTQASAARPRPIQIVRQGFTVGILNPKSLVFFVAVFPHFVSPIRHHVAQQFVLLGAIFCVLAFCSDSTWGISAAVAREWLATSAQRLVRLRVVGAVVMMGLGLLVFVSAAV